MVKEARVVDLSSGPWRDRPEGSPGSMIGGTSGESPSSEVNFGCDEDDREPWANAPARGHADLV